MTKFKYNANEYLRQAQRYTIPLYKKDELGHYHFSSTGTFVIYNENLFLIGALHALDKNNDNIDNLYFTNTTNGHFEKITRNAIGFQKFDEKYDIFIIDFYNNIKFQNKNYFNLNNAPSHYDLDKFEMRGFYWLGFPESWQDLTKKRKTYNPNDFLDKYVHTKNDNTYITSNKFFALPSIMIDSDKENFVCGLSPLGEVDFTYGGKKHMPKLQGMSGGCLFLSTKTQQLAKLVNGEIDLDNSFIFLGIGLECCKINNKECKIYGLDRATIEKLLQEYLDENPLQIILCTPDKK